MTAVAGPGVGATFRADCACEYAAARNASVEVCKFLAGQGVPEEEVAALELALVEAVNNAVEHSTEAAKALPIRIEAAVGAGEVELRVLDHTPGFDWPEQAELPGDDDENGRGVYLIQTIADRSNYFRARGQNILVFAKNVAVQNTAAEAEFPDAAAQVAELECTLEGMTEELSYTYETLNSIFQYSSRLAASQNVEEFATRLILDAQSLAEADFVLLRLYDANAKVLRMQRSEPAVELADLKVDAVESREAESARTRQDTWFDSTHPLAPGDPLRAVGVLGSGVCHPLALNEQLFGTITLARRSAEVPFRAAQVNVLQTLADFLAIQIANDRFMEERMQSQVVRRELDIAASIQRSLLPTEIPSAAPYSIATCCESARDVGGDFLDVIPVDDSAVLFVVADVMGKGIPAALFAAILRSVVRSLPQNFADPALLLWAVNRILYDDLSKVDMFATAQVVYLDRVRRRLLTASAGHCPLLIVQTGEGTTLRIEASGPPLGVVPEVGYFAQMVQLQRNDRILLYTDGVTELANPEGDMFGEARLGEWFAEARHVGHTAPQLSAELKQELARFQRGQAHRDDQTYIVITQDAK